MASQGWISVHRKIEDDWLWKDKPFSKGQAWIDLLLMVNHEDKKILFNGNLVEVKRGQRITSIKKLCDRWGWSNKKVKRFLELLQEDDKIGLEIAPRKNTVITIVNYSVYQDAENEKAPEKHQRSTTEASQKHINNNERIMINNDNNDDEIYILNILEQTLNKKISQSSVNKLIKTYGAENVKLLAKKIGESTWLKQTINLNKISKKFFTSILEDKYKDYEKKEEVEDNKYDWYKPLDI